MMPFDYVLHVSRPPRLDPISRARVRTWAVFGRFEHPLHPSALSTQDQPERNEIRGVPGSRIRIRHEPSGTLVALYEWDWVPENPNDPDSTRMRWGWKLLSKADVPLPFATNAAFQSLPWGTSA